MNVRTARVFRDGNSKVIALPPDWLRGNGVSPGDEVEVWYNGELRIRAKPKRAEGVTGEAPVPAPS